MGQYELVCLRHTLFVVNVIFWILGCAILAAGIWLRVAFGDYATFLQQYRIVSIDIACLVIGALTFLLSFFACCGAWFKSRCLLMTYFLMLVTAFILQVGVITAIFALREPISTALSNELRSGIHHSFNNSENNSVAKIWSSIQTHLGCCGVEQPEDWFSISAWPTKDWVPVSCCRISYRDNPKCGRMGNRDMWYAKGCYGKLGHLVIQKLHILAVVALVLLFMQLFGLIASMLIFCSIDTYRRSRTYRSYQTDS